MPGCDAAAGLEGFTRGMRTRPASVRKTLTYDQGREMARHQGLARRLSIHLYFAALMALGNDPPTRTPTARSVRSPPKGTDLSGISQRRLTQIASTLRTRPRKCLGFRTPQEIMAQQIGQLSSCVVLQS